MYRPDDVLDLLGEGGVVRALEAAHPVRLQAMLLPDPLDGAQRDPDRVSQGATSPMGDLSRRLGTAERKNLSDSAGGMGCLAGRAGLVAQEAIHTLLGVALLPAPDGGPADPRLLGDLQDGEALGREQHDVGALNVLEGPCPIGDDGGHARLVGFGEDQADSLSHASDSHGLRFL
jgi:hypothetical protein